MGGLCVTPEIITMFSRVSKLVDYDHNRLWNWRLGWGRLEYVKRTDEYHLAHLDHLESLLSLEDGVVNWI